MSTKLTTAYVHSCRFVVCSHMRSHPMSEKTDHDRMSELEVRMADATNLAGLEKIPQVRHRILKQNKNKNIPNPRLNCVL